MLRLSLDADPPTRRPAAAAGPGHRLVRGGPRAAARRSSATTDVHRLAVAIRSAVGIEALVWLTDVAGLSRRGGRRADAVDHPRTAGAGPRRRRRDYLSRLTPRAMTSTESISADTDSVAISSLARGESGIVSVGLNAEELVTET